MNGYECPCCGGFIGTTTTFRRRECPHCHASVLQQNAARNMKGVVPTPATYGLTAADLPGGIFDDREDH